MQTGTAGHPIYSTVDRLQGLSRALGAWLMPKT